MTKDSSRTLLFIAFSASGFAGLIYESVWTQYLKLFLGHAAYAQTLVLAVFMGGMALGSWVCARFSRRWRDLLLLYALIEGFIGVAALGFHPVYTAFVDLAYNVIIPRLGSPFAVAAFKWSASTLMILPQSILLGMTFPLLSAGMLRADARDAGATLSTLYFTNSIGAAAGILAAGFLFIGWAGLQGALAVAGIINIVVAVTVWRLRTGGETTMTLQWVERQDRAAAGPSIRVRLLLFVALLTGASSFMYEIAWIRLLDLVLSSATHAFELMVSAFITGLALGGLWVKRRIDSSGEPLLFLAFVQVAMGVLALATLPLYGKSFTVMAWLMENLPKSASGYFLYNLGSHGIALAVMLPATFCAGMTLPLITYALLRGGGGEEGIGSVYAFNTVGAILGVFFAVHIAMPVFGLKGLLGIGAGIDIALGLVILWRTTASAHARALWSCAGAGALLVVMLGVGLDPYKLASGVFRTGELLSPDKSEILYHRDGKTATVSIVRTEGLVDILTNGKSDATIDMSGRGSAEDETTMVLLGALALSSHPAAKTAANIGWGSGLTTHTLLSSPQLDRVDSIEIEPAMVDAARNFLPRVSRAYEDPRSHLHIEDAKTFFSVNKSRYDLIISEPSNPWVSGVASLFTMEFYGRIRDHLAPGGIFVQWLQLYEIDMPLVASVFKALSYSFGDYVVYGANRGDLVIIACVTGTAPDIDRRVLGEQGLEKELRRISVGGADDVAVRKIGDRAFLAPLFESYPIGTNSDYVPVLDLRAARALFLGSSATDLLGADLRLLPAAEMLGHRPDGFRNVEVRFSPYYERSYMIHLAKTLYSYHLDGEWRWPHPEVPLADDVPLLAVTVRRSLAACGQPEPEVFWWDGMFLDVASRMVPYLSAEQMQVLWKQEETKSCWSTLSPEQRNFVMLLKAVSVRDGRSMSRIARDLLESGANMGQDILHYTLAAGLLGELSLGNFQEGALLWNRYGKLLDKAHTDSLLMRLLVGRLGGPSSRV